MARNKLLPVPPMPPKDPRCTGRTTAAALDLISRALANQGHTCYGRDHFDGLGGAHALYSEVRDCIEKLDLKHMAVAIVAHGDRYRDHVRVQSNIWED